MCGSLENLDCNNYGENACPGPQPNSSGWEDGKLWNDRNGRSGKLSHSNDACICSNDVSVCGFTHCGCVVNGSVAMAAFEYNYYSLH